MFVEFVCCHWELPTDPKYGFCARSLPTGQTVAYVLEVKGGHLSPNSGSPVGVNLGELRGWGGVQRLVKILGLLKCARLRFEACSGPIRMSRWAWRPSNCRSLLDKPVPDVACLRALCVLLLPLKAWKHPQYSSSVPVGSGACWSRSMRFWLSRAPSFPHYLPVHL